MTALKGAGQLQSPPESFFSSSHTPREPLKSDISAYHYHSAWMNSQSKIKRTVALERDRDTS